MRGQHKGLASLSYRLRGFDNNVPPAKITLSSAKCEGALRNSHNFSTIVNEEYVKGQQGQKRKSGD